ncbi:MAG: hypothetical protein N3G80_02795 [Candidatus Micrarchaeota archaeon]|nr:hypothetical protein [Candidatus Micrarchaeota archaeon]
MRILDWIKEKYIYLVVLVLLFLLLLVIYSFQQGQIEPEAARVYVQALTTVATLALLYYAYFSAVSKKEGEIASLELAVRPVFLWKVEVIGKEAIFEYKVIKHPVYDLKINLAIGAEKMTIEERHLDVAEGANQEKKVDITKLVTQSMKKEETRLLYVEITYHSEIGGKYEFLFTKEVVQKGGKIYFQHRKIVSAKYPWRTEEVRFD